MNYIKVSSVALTALIIAACHTSKKSTNTTTSTTATTNTTSTTANSTAVGPALPAKSSDGIYAPGNEELMAIQTKYSDATLDKLKEGHSIYTAGACIQCHSPKNIYSRKEENWQNIINNMAQKAQITESQKDAVYKYVMAIKATQPK